MNILCKIFGHKSKNIDPHRGHAGPSICFRCGHYEPGIVCPRRPTRPKEIELRGGKWGGQRIFIKEGATNLNIPVVSADGMGMRVYTPTGEFTPDGVEIWE